MNLTHRLQNSESPSGNSRISSGEMRPGLRALPRASDPGPRYGGAPKGHEFGPGIRKGFRCLPAPDGNERHLSRCLPRGRTRTRGS